MNVLARAGDDALAMVYVAEMSGGRRIEFVESLQPPRPREEKWVVIVSTMFGCPIGCGFCDAGGGFQGNLSSAEILAQISWIVERRYGGAAVPARMFKVQFARMGEPALNPAVLDALEELPDVVNAPGVYPSLSSVAPKGSDRFFARLLDIVPRVYGGRFQLQFSLHTSDEVARRAIVPVEGWSFARIGDYGSAFHEVCERKIGLNFALDEHAAIDPDTLRAHFSPDHFMIKLTPINPTARARANGYHSAIHPARMHHAGIDALRRAGYEVMVSIGEWEENRIGSNCGQYLARLGAGEMEGAYSYPIERL